MRRGEVRWYTFAQPDKRRPVVILSRDAVLDYLGEVTVAPVTSTIRDIPSDVLLSPDRLKGQSWCPHYDIVLGEDGRAPACLALCPWF